MKQPEKDLSALGEQQIKKKKLYDEQELDNVRVQMGKKISPYAIPNNLDLSEKIWVKIESQLGEIFHEVNGAKDMLRDKLTEWESAYHQEPLDIADEDESFPDSCKLRSSFTATSCAIVTNKIYKATTVAPYFIATVRGDKEKENKLQDYVNNQCELGFDYKAFMRELSEKVPKYPFVVVIPERVREVKTCHDFRVFENIYKEETGELVSGGMEQFKAMYPDGESLSVNDDMYDEKVKELQEELDDHDYMEFHYDYDRVYEKTNVNVVHPLNYAQFPWDCDEHLAKLSAYKTKKTFDQLIRLERDGIIKDKQARLIPVRHESSDTAEEVDTVKEAKDEKGAIDSTNNIEDYKNKVYEPYVGYVRLSAVDLETGDTYTEVDYEFWYLVDEKILLRLAPVMYNYRARNIIKIAIGPMCVPEMAENPQKVLDTLVRQYIDSNSMSTLPEFSMSDGAFKELQRTRDDMKHRLGKVWRLKAGTMMPLTKPITYGPGFMSLIQHVTQDNEARIGAIKSMTGQPLAGDPGASGVKTQALLQQSDFMISRYIDNISLGLSLVMIHILKQDRQFEKFSRIPVKRYSLGTSKVDYFDRDDIDFDENITSFTVKTQRLDDNVELRKEEARKDLEFYGAVPIIGQNPQAMRIIIKNTIARDPNYTIEEAEQIVPTQEAIQAEQVEIQKDAMIKMQKEQEAEGLNQEMQDVSAQGDMQMDTAMEEQQIEGGM